MQLTTAPLSPAALAATHIRRLDGNWLYIECHRHAPFHCRRLSIGMLPRKSRYTTLASIVKRLSCVACKMPPSVVIVHEFRQRFESDDALKGWHYQMVPEFKVLNAAVRDE